MIFVILGFLPKEFISSTVLLGRSSQVVRSLSLGRLITTSNNNPLTASNNACSRYILYIYIYISIYGYYIWVASFQRDGVVLFSVSTLKVDASENLYK